MGQKKDAGARTRSGDAQCGNIDGNTEICKRSARAVGHALRNMRRQIRGDRSAADPPQRTGSRELERARPSIMQLGRNRASLDMAFNLAVTDRIPAPTFQL